ncbi:hypothetical protein LTR78_001618 [Recurvomyces mirabilis]|uniref:Uncharacterized protein n=1 Tax=Recurvomyces mirabilis TaxID=574656 RepID=A0AAE0WUY3_9PEZI|nr:hypothetical protein LTR78_001618 [Recurvomyces mirabilis]KAK5151810.1 hypothetical protein LTS14_008944 [Recurvomyces mirabilis]
MASGIEDVESITGRVAHQYDEAKKDFEVAQAHQEAVIEAACIDTEAIQDPLTVPGLLNSSSSPLSEKCAESARQPMLVSETKTKEDIEASNPEKPAGSLQYRANDYSNVLWHWEGEYTNRLSLYGCAVKRPNGSWYILECRVCHANLPNNLTSRNGILDGIKAFYVHLRQAHGMDFGDDVMACREHCQLIKQTIVPETTAEKAEIIAARAQPDLTRHKGGSTKREFTDTWDYGRGQLLVDFSYGGLGNDYDNEKDLAAYTPSLRKAKIATKCKVITVSDDDEGQQYEEISTVFPFDTPKNLVRRKTPKKTKGHHVNSTNDDDDIDGEVRISSPYFRETAPRPASILASTPANTDRSLETLRS